LKSTLRYFTVLLLLFNSINIYSQEDLEEYEIVAYQLIEEGNFRDALEIFTILDSISPNNPDYIFNLGICKFHGVDKALSLTPFLKSKTLGGTNPLLDYYIGRAYQFNYDYENATYYLEQHLSTLDTSRQQDATHQDIENILSEIKNSRDQLIDKLSVNIQNLGPSVNSDAPDYVPLVINDGKTLIFTSRREGESKKKADDGHFYEDIYIAEKDSLGRWTTTQSHENYNTKSHDAVVALNWKGDKLFLFRSTLANQGDIYVSSKIDGKWAKPESVKGINTNFWEGSLTINKNEDKIYFSSDRPDGFGGSDIYEAVLDEDGETWVDIKNLGPTINTEFDEDAPYIHSDNQTLFFSSKGHHSGGGYDIYSSKLKDTVWQEVKNLSYPINSADDDIYFHLTADGGTGYFTSHRHSSYSVKSVGEKDLFSLSRPYKSPFHFVLKGKVFEEKNLESRTALVSLTDLETDQTFSEVADINTGKFKFNIAFKKPYLLKVTLGDVDYFSKEVYFPYEADLFESLLEIPIPDLPELGVKLSDLTFSSEETDSLESGIVIYEKQPSILLSRKYRKGDLVLKELLVSDNIPLSFRKKLAKQLKNDSLISESDFTEDEFVGNDFGSLFGEEEEVNEKFSKLSSSEVGRLERTGARIQASLAEESDQSIMKERSNLKKLKPEQKILIDRFTDYLLSPESQKVIELKTVDRINYENLSLEEKSFVNKMIQFNLFEDKDNFAKNLDEDSLFKASLTKDESFILEKIIEKNTEENRMFLPSGVLDRTTGKAWNRLAQLSTMGFSPRKRSMTSGRVLLNKNNLPAANETLLLVNEEGNLIQSIETDSTGFFQFENLAPNESFLILINDYTLSLTGKPKFKMTDLVVKPMDKGYYNFYDKLTEEEKRRIDRIIAYQNLKDGYENDPGLLWQDKNNYAKLNQKDKGLIDGVARYLMANDQNNPDFTMDRDDGYNYEKLDYGERGEFNRYITAQVLNYDSTTYDFSLDRDDQVFYDKLTEEQKGFLEELKNDRKKKNIIFDNLLFRAFDTQSWVPVGEFDSRKMEDEIVDVKGKLLHTNEATPLSDIKLAIMDESNQLTSLFYTREEGNFNMFSIPTGKSYQVLLSLSPRIQDLDGYSIRINTIEKGKPDFYSSLSANEREAINRAISLFAQNISEEDNQLIKKEKAYFDRLGVEEMELLDQIHDPLFVNNNVRDSLLLDRQLLNYMKLQLESNGEISPEIVRQFYNNEITDTKLEPTKFDYKKVRISESEYLRLQSAKINRTGLFAIPDQEPIIEVVDNAWVKIKEYTIPNKKFDYYDVKGTLQYGLDTTKTTYTKIILTDANDESIMMTYPLSNNDFSFSHLTDTGRFSLYVEDKSAIKKQYSRFSITNFKITYAGEVKIERKPPPKIDSLTISFDFDSYQIQTDVKKMIDRWYSKLIISGTPSLVIEGHTDLVGSTSYNNALSKKRASAVREYIIKKGYNGSLLTIKAKGETSPLVDSEERSASNRRVVIKLLIEESD